MSPNHLAERECHRARALADTLADVRLKLDELESLQRAMVASGIEPRHIITAEAREHLEKWFFYHEKRSLWRLRHPGASMHHAAVTTAKRRARVVHGQKHG